MAEQIYMKIAGIDGMPTINGASISASVSNVISTDGLTISGDGNIDSPAGLMGDLLYVGHVDMSRTANASTTVSFGVKNATVPAGYEFVGWLGWEIYSGPNNPPRAAGYCNCHDNLYWGTTSASFWAYFNTQGTYSARGTYLCVKKGE